VRAPEVLNALAGRYIEQRQRNYHIEARATIDYLRHQLDTIAVQLATTEQQLRVFRERESVVDLSRESSAGVTRLAEMDATRANLEVERSSLSEILQEVRRAGASDSAGQSYRRLMAYPALVKSQATSELVRSLAHLEDERAALISRRRPTDPDVQALDTRIAQLEGELKGAVNTYYQGIANQVNALDRQIGSYERELSTIPAKEMQFARLSRQARFYEEIYDELQTRLKQAEVVQAVEDPSVRIIDPASVTEDPLRTKRMVILLIGLMVGLVLGLGGAFAREILDHSVHSRADLQTATGLPVLGLIPHLGIPGRVGRQLRKQNERAQPKRIAASSSASRKAGNRLPAPSAPLMPASAAVQVLYAPRKLAEKEAGPAAIVEIAQQAFQRLQMHINWARPGEEMRVLLFTSPLPGDGKTTTTTSFAISLARQGRRVVLIDADLRRRTLSAEFQAQKSPGLGELLAGVAVPQDVIQVVDAGNSARFHFIPAGQASAEAAMLLRSPSLESLLQAFREEYEFVLIDTPPSTIVTDAAVIAPLVDGVLLVARAGVTPHDVLEHAARELREANISLLGTILNDIHFERESTYDSAYKVYAYGSAYYSGKE
jgi:capsular exopolysaccharide synthesis family protein